MLRVLLLVFPLYDLVAVGIARHDETLDERRKHRAHQRMEERDAVPLGVPTTEVVEQNADVWHAVRQLVAELRRAVRDLQVAEVSLETAGELPEKRLADRRHRFISGARECAFLLPHLGCIIN